MHGFTLVEIMVAMVIGLILMAGTIQIFIGNKQTYRNTEASSRLQENARFAINRLTKDLRMAGFWGCANLSSATNHVNVTGGALDFGSGGIGGTEGGGTNPDSIILRGARAGGLTVELPYMPTPSGALQISTPNTLSVDDIIIVSDCVNADALQITGPQDPGTTGTINHNTGAGVPGNATQPLSKSYQGDASVYEAVEYNYSIATGANGQNALFRSENLAAATELVENIENMQIIYGEDTDTNYVANYYGDIDEVTANNVVSIRIVLTAVSDNNITTVASANSVSGATDNRLRKTFTTTIGVRNYLK